MKVRKIKNIKNFDYELFEKELIEELTEEGFNRCNWNFPNKNSYVIINGEEIIPAYINVKENEALTLWVSPKRRREGLATFLVRSVNVRYATSLPSSVIFWRSINFKRVGNQFVK